VGARLPSEAEWEWGAAAGGEAIFPWGDDFRASAAHFLDTPPLGVTPASQRNAQVAAYPGHFYDIVGNAYEWVADDACDYSDWPAGASSCHTGGAQGVVRGGSFASDGGALRTTYRRFMAIDSRIDTNGFRCAASNPGR
jgi:formylglycine-generating enzyme required for sulfatase activity